MQKRRPVSLGGLTVEILESDTIGFAVPRCFPVRQLRWIRPISTGSGSTGEQDLPTLQNSGHRTKRHAIRPVPNNACEILRVILRHVPQKELAGLYGFNFCVPWPATCNRILRAVLWHGQTFCRVAAEPETGRANLRIALRRDVVGRSARNRRRQSAQFSPRQQTGD